MTPEEAIKIMATLTAAFPRTEIGEQTILVYAKFLADIPYEAGQAAILNLIAGSKFFPTVAELRQAALKLIPGKQLPTPEEAWGEVSTQIRVNGYYRVPVFSHPVIEQAVKAMGWQELCTSENGIADRAHFMRIYESFRDRALEDTVRIPEARLLVDRLAQQLPTRVSQLVSQIGRPVQETAS